jgi:hypothetical protein
MIRLDNRLGSTVAERLAPESLARATELLGIMNRTATTIRQARITDSSRMVLLQGDYDKAEAEFRSITAPK